MAIYFLVRNLAKGPGAGLKCDQQSDAEKAAKRMAKEYKTEYTVFKVTEARQGTYRPGDDYG